MPAPQPNLRIVIPSSKPLQQYLQPLATPRLESPLQTPTDEWIAKDWPLFELCPNSAGSDSTLFSNCDFPPHAMSEPSLNLLDDQCLSFLDLNFDCDETNSNEGKQPTNTPKATVPPSPARRRDRSNSLYKDIDISGCQVTKKPCAHKRRGSVTIYSCPFDG
ncbi:hypothetical protein HDU98_006051, partial [Podochytrium sp. JEL0797]